jgi:hypothetical protein
MDGFHFVAVLTARAGSTATMTASSNAAIATRRHQKIAANVWTTRRKKMKEEDNGLTGSAKASLDRIKRARSYHARSTIKETT